MGSADSAEVRRIYTIIFARIAWVLSDLEKVDEEICVCADDADKAARGRICQRQQIGIVGKRIGYGLTQFMPADVIQQFLRATALRKHPGKKEIEGIAVDLQSGQSRAVEISRLGKVFEDVGGSGSV